MVIIIKMCACILLKSLCIQAYTFVQSLAVNLIDKMSDKKESRHVLTTLSQDALKYGHLSN